MFHEIFKPVEVNEQNRDIMLEIQDSGGQDSKNSKKMVNKYISEISEAASHQEKDGNTSSML
jgi:hypothetical protein